MEQDELCCLRYDKVCIPALAYLLWRISVEGKRSIAELRVHSDVPQTVKTHLPDELNQIFSSYEGLRWIYLDFFGIWRTLEEHLLRFNRLIVMRGKKNFNDHGLLWDWATENDTDSTELLAARNGIRVVYPFPPMEMKYENTRWGSAIQTKDDLIDIPALNNQCTWAWTNYGSPEDGPIFKFTHSEFGIKTHFRYFYV